MKTSFDSVIRKSQSETIKRRNDNTTNPTTSQQWLTLMTRTSANELTAQHHAH